MFFSVKALVFGEDFTTDPVSKALGFCLRSFSKGRLALNLQLFSQVRGLCLPARCLHARNREQTCGCRRGPGSMTATDWMPAHPGRGACLPRVSLRPCACPRCCDMS